MSERAIGTLSLGAFAALLAAIWSATMKFEGKLGALGVVGCLALLACLVVAGVFYFELVRSPLGFRSQLIDRLLRSGLAVWGVFAGFLGAIGLLAAANELVTAPASQGGNVVAGIWIGFGALLVGLAAPIGATTWLGWILASRGTSAREQYLEKKNQWLMQAIEDAGYELDDERLAAFERQHGPATRP